jgi:hypothetical protein
MRFGSSRTRAAVGAVVAGCALLASCSSAASEDEVRRTNSPATVEPGEGGPSAPEVSGAGEAEPDENFSVPDPGPLKGKLLTADVLVTSTETIPASVLRRLADLKGVEAAMPFSMASLSSNGRTLTIAAVDPAQYRRFTTYPVATADAVWSRVAGGEVAVDPSVGKKLEEPRGYLTLGTQEDAPEVHIGAYAPMVKNVSAVVARPRGDQMGMPDDNAVLVSTGRLTPSVLTGKMKKVIGEHATLQVLALEFDVDIPQTAVLTGTTAADAVGSFSYTPHADGRITPDPAWVAANIRTEQVPILGNVTCHKVMIPQLRAALSDVITEGLADKIHPDEFAGCYYPRYIGYDPAKGLSLHSWGIAVDLNVPGNQRGTVGEMDRRVVAIFKKWGFAWGGDWNYTDPMHFELASIVKPG